jgi:23S rRNA (cytidine1920-2'-O)/16S rRNA (cytidine1409-2'-O)-methyltransferase
MPGKPRLDALLVDRGLVATRSRAQALIMAGRVTVDGSPVTKAGTPTAPDAELALAVSARYVSRGGEKLQTGLEAFAVDPSGLRCLDLGSSTGGFTDCLLQHGAAAVAAVDVGHHQLHERLRGDPRVTVLEGVNARTLARGQLPFAPALITADVSFISLRLVLPPAVACAEPKWRAVVLVKPQFEAGREWVRKGVVRDPEVRRRVLQELAQFVAEGGLGSPAAVLGVCDSSLPGPAGNREYLLDLAAAGHPIARERATDVQAAIEVAVGDR